MTDHTSTDCNCRFCSFSHLHQLLGLFFSPSFFCLNILRLHPPPPLCRCWLCLCAFVYIQFVIIWLWRSYSSGHPGSLCWRWDPLVAYFFFYIYIHANTHRVRTVCRFATNSSPFLKLFFWVVKLGLQLNVGWLSRHKLKRMNDYSYVFKIITGVFIKGFWMQLNFISVISTHKFFPSPSISCHIPDEQACCFQTISKTSSCHLKCVYWQDP